jgi:hypothetical protein
LEKAAPTNDTTKESADTGNDLSEQSNTPQKVELNENKKLLDATVTRLRLILMGKMKKSECFVLIPQKHIIHVWVYRHFDLKPQRDSHHHDENKKIVRKCRKWLKY